MSKNMVWHVWEVTYLRRNVTIVCGTSYHLLGSQISQDSKIRFWLQVEFYISDWRFSESRHLARYVSCHNDMAYDIPLDEIMCRFSPYCRHTTQTMVIKAGKSDRLCWDGSTTIKPTDIVMNQVTPITCEAPITFRHVKMQFYIDIYNTCVSYPTSIILLAMADVKACFVSLAYT